MEMGETNSEFGIARGRSEWVFINTKSACGGALFIDAIFA
jgi:hypothetical protein